MTTPYQPGFQDRFQDVPPAPSAADLVVQVPAARTAPITAPGWYPEPGKPGVLRYWNGASWEEWRKPLVEAPRIEQGKSIAVAYLLLIFVGGTGAHRFYLGRTATAVTMLILWLVGLATAVFFVGFLLLGAVGVWNIIDLFLVPGMVRQGTLRAVGLR